MHAKRPGTPACHLSCPAICWALTCWLLQLGFMPCVYIHSLCATFRPGKAATSSQEQAECLFCAKSGAVSTNRVNFVCMAAVLHCVPWPYIVKWYEHTVASIWLTLSSILMHLPSMHVWESTISRLIGRPCRPCCGSAAWAGGTGSILIHHNMRALCLRPFPSCRDVCWLCCQLAQGVLQAQG